MQGLFFVVAFPCFPTILPHIYLAAVNTRDGFENLSGSHRNTKGTADFTPCCFDMDGILDLFALSLSVL